MNRENQKIKYFEAFRYSQISEKIGEYKDYPTESLEKEIEALLIDAKEEQVKRKADNPAYIILFFLIQVFIQNLINICLLRRMKVCI